MSLTMAPHDLAAAVAQVSPAHGLAGAVEQANLAAPWKRQVSPAETCSTAAPDEYLDLLDDLREAAAVSRDPSIASSQVDESDSEDDCTRLALSVRRLVMRDARFCPAAAAAESEDEDEDIDAMPAAARG
mmetsp:Transcript_92969/g.240179  ORF Transcript_92969/g.240179 Transcript_92969/m.240179 type:complete len:130 (-) Transcript_92969:124-513(-)